MALEGSINSAVVFAAIKTTDSYAPALPGEREEVISLLQEYGHFQEADESLLDVYVYRLVEINGQRYVVYKVSDQVDEDSYWVLVTSISKYSKTLPLEITIIKADLLGSYLEKSGELSSASPQAKEGFDNQDIRSQILSSFDQIAALLEQGKSRHAISLMIGEIFTQYDKKLILEVFNTHIDEYINIFNTLSAERLQVIDLDLELIDYYSGYQLTTYLSLLLNKLKYAAKSTDDDSRVVIETNIRRLIDAITAMVDEGNMDMEELVSYWEQHAADLYILQSEFDDEVTTTRWFSRGDMRHDISEDNDDYGEV